MTSHPTPLVLACLLAALPLACSETSRCDSDSDCLTGQRCEARRCVDACQGVVCDDPPADGCADATTVRRYGAAGECHAGLCVYPAADEECPAGQLCEAGACQACVPEWVDFGACHCDPEPCAGCTGGRDQVDGCGHTRQVDCELPASGCPAGQSCTADGLCAVRATNPVLTGDHPDPHVIRLVGPGGAVSYLLTHTAGDGGDLPAYTSGDLVHWQALPAGLFAQPRVPGASLEVNGSSLCALWGPQVVELRPDSYLLSVSALRFAAPQAACPAYAEDGGVYLAWSPTPAGPFARADHPWEPFPAGANEANCPAEVRAAVPHAVDYASRNCQGTWCHQIVRLDSDVWRDPATGRWWLAYAWYTNSPPQVEWEQTNHGEHVHLTELDAADPFAVRCDTSVAQIYAANPQDPDMITRLAAACPGCDQMLSFTRGRFGEEVLRDGVSWGVVEGPNLFRRGDWVYLLLSGAMWDSPYYHVFWAAARSVEELTRDNPERLLGRYLIPSAGQAFGHGTAVLGPDGAHWYFVHHRLDSGPCQTAGDCHRDLWVSPLEFEDRGDGLGAVHIAPRRPAETPEVEVIQ